jgi:putative aldouronate transport system permease protein
VGLFINAIMIGVIALVCVYPYLNIVAKSFNDQMMVRQGKVKGIWPVQFSTTAYEMVFRGNRFMRSLGNTVFVTLVGTAINLTATLFVAYGVTRYHLPGRRLIMILYIISMVFSGGLIPFYLTVINAGMRNSLFALFIPLMVSPFNLILMRNFMNGIPYEIASREVRKKASVLRQNQADLPCRSAAAFITSSEM